jgi:hypothetical protein
MEGASKARKIIARWSDTIKVGIWDNESWTLRLYEDRALLRFPVVKWRSNSGSLDYVSTRIEGRIHEDLLRIAREEVEDCEDYTQKVRTLVWDEMV